MELLPGKKHLCIYVLDTFEGCFIRGFKYGRLLFNESLQHTTKEFLETFRVYVRNYDFSSYWRLIVYYIPLSSMIKKEKERFRSTV